MYFRLEASHLDQKTTQLSSSSFHLAEMITESKCVDRDQKPLSILEGPTDPPLLNLHLGSLLSQQASLYGSRLALVSSAQGIRHTFASIYDRSLLVARALIALGIGHGDMVGIMTGNCSEYAELFFACGHIGAILAVFNATYTVDELHQALLHSGL